MKELKPCPLCGAKMIRRGPLGVDEKRITFWMHEKKIDRSQCCLASTLIFPANVDLWNTRKTPKSICKKCHMHGECEAEKMVLSKITRCRQYLEVS